LVISARRFPSDRRAAIKGGAASAMMASPMRHRGDGTRL